MNVLPVLITLAILNTTQQGRILLAEKRAPTPGEWSANAVYLGYGLGALDGGGKYRVSKVPSPDAGKVIMVKNERLHVTDSAGKSLAGNYYDWIPTLSEVLWSPDSIAFAVTSSFGGYVGDWHVRVYLIKGNRVTGLKVTTPAQRDAMRRYRCNPSQPNEPPEFGALAWQNGSRKLLIAAQVPPHSSCPDMGKLFGYVVSVPDGHILIRLSEAQIRTEYGPLLGARLARRK